MALEKQNIKEIRNKKKKEEKKEEALGDQTAQSFPPRLAPPFPRPRPKPIAPLLFLFPSLGLVAQPSSSSTLAREIKQAGPNPGLVGRTSLSLRFLSSVADEPDPRYESLTGGTRMSAGFFNLKP